MNINNYDTDVQNHVGVLINSKLLKNNKIKEQEVV